MVCAKLGNNILLHNTNFFYQISNKIEHYSWNGLQNRMGVSKPISSIFYFSAVPKYMLAIEYHVHI